MAGTPAQTQSVTDADAGAAAAQAVAAPPVPLSDRQKAKEEFAKTQASIYAAPDATKTQSRRRK